MVRHGKDTDISLVLNDALHTLFYWPRFVPSKSTYVFYCHHVSLSLSLCLSPPLSLSFYFFASLSRAHSFLYFFMHVFLWWLCLDTFAFYFLYVLYRIEDWNWNEQFWWICRFRQNTIAIIDGVWSMQKRTSGQCITTARYCYCCCCRCCYFPKNYFANACKVRACNTIDEIATIVLWKTTSRNSRILCALRSVQFKSYVPERKSRTRAYLQRTSNHINMQTNTLKM